MVDYKRFNEHAELFLRRMNETFPQEKKIIAYRAKFDAVSSISPREPVKMFMESMIPYGEQILKKEEQFFKQQQFVEKAESISQKMGLIEYWDTMGETTQNTIWEFIQGLFILGMGVTGRQTELQQLIQSTEFSAV